MPELPEVTNVVNALNKLGTFTVTDVELSVHAEPRFSQAGLLLDRQILGWERLGKHIVTVLDTNFGLTHLGMTGQILVNPTQIDSHCHIVANCVNVDEEILLVWRDPRRFGNFRYVSSRQTLADVTDLGPDLLSSIFDTTYLMQMCQKTATPIKSVLLDQHTVAGIGNYLADETCFEANLNPRRPANSLTSTECDRLVMAAKRLATASIQVGGVSVRDYVHPDGSKGAFQNELKVYGRKNKPCVVCNTPLMFTKVGARSTTYCEQCQP